MLRSMMTVNTFNLICLDDEAVEAAPASYYANQSINMSGSGGGVIPGMGIGKSMKGGSVIPGLNGGNRPDVPAQRPSGAGSDMGGRDMGRHRGGSGGFGAGQGSVGFGGGQGGGFNANTAPLGQRSSYYGGQGGQEQRGQVDQRGGHEQRGGNHNGGHQNGGGYQQGGQQSNNSACDYYGNSQRSPPRDPRSAPGGGEPVAYGSQTAVPAKPTGAKKSASDFYK